MEAEGNFLRAVESVWPPDSLGVDILPVGAVVTGDLAIRRVTDTRRCNGKWIVLDVLQVIIARRRQIEIPGALGVALERDGIAHMLSLIHISEPTRQAEI